MGFAAEVAELEELDEGASNPVLVEDSPKALLPPILPAIA